MIPIELVTAVARGDRAEWPATASAADESAFLAAVVEHSLEALMFWRLRQAGRFHEWPGAIRSALERTVREEVVLEAGREGELRVLLEALDRANVAALLMKGAALAYTCYPEPWLRPRNDNDLLVRSADVPAADRVLVSLGYTRAHALAGTLITNQRQYVKVDRLGLWHVVDLHWKISNRPSIADVLPFDKLHADAIVVPALGGCARALGNMHAVVLACLHPAAHHYNAENLSWVYDIHLLASRFDDAQFTRLVSFARERQVAALCAAGLTRAVTHFHTAIPQSVMRHMRILGEPSAAFLGAAPWRGDVRLSDFRALPDWRAKLGFVREVALPGSDYMLREYHSSSRLLIPALHVHRLTRGAWRLLRRYLT